MRLFSSLAFATQRPCHSVAFMTARRVPKPASRWRLAALLLAVLGTAVHPVAACTSVLVTRGASADGSVIIPEYNDGYVRTEQGETSEVGYPEAWLRRVIQERGAQLRLPEAPPKGSDR